MATIKLVISDIITLVAELVYLPDKLYFLCVVSIWICYLETIDIEAEK